MKNMKKLKLKIKELKIKQKELAKRCGVACALVSHHAINGIKTARVAKRYAKALDCDWKDLLD